MISETRRQQIIRELGCLVPNCASGPVQLHHVRTAANSGVAMKPSDAALVPLCFWHHRQFHQIGRKSFERVHQLDLMAESHRLAQIEREMP